MLDVASAHVVDIGAKNTTSTFDSVEGNNSSYLQGAVVCIWIQSWKQEEL